MRRLFSAALVAALALGVPACSGYNSSPTPAGPSSAPTDGAITIDIAGINGDRSFSPNPATVSPGKTVVWHNVDTTTHRVVFDDGELDTGNIAPGGYSAPMTFPAPGPYHCSIHPAMVGRIIGG